MVCNRHIHGWQSTLKILRVACVRTESMSGDGRGWEHGAVRVFKFFLENDKDDFAKSFEVDCCTAMVSQKFTVVYDYTTVAKSFERHLIYIYETWYFSIHLGYC